MNDKKWLFLDIDDTLCNTKATHLPALKVCFKYLGKYLPKLKYQDFLTAYYQARAFIHQKLGPTAQSHDRERYFKKMFDDLKIKKSSVLAKKLNSLYWQTVNEKLKLLSGVEKTLQILQKRKIKLGIITDHLHKIQIKKLETLKIKKYFSFIVTSEDAGYDKPHPDIFKLALKKAKANPKEVVMFGDDCAKDYQGALKNNLTSVDLNPSDCPIGKNSLKSFAEILRFFPVNQKSTKIDDGYVKFKANKISAKILKVTEIKELNLYRERLRKAELIGDNGKVGFGNISKRHRNGFIISGTDTGKIKNLRPADYAFVKNWKIEKNNLNYEGTTEPSSESLTHAILYQTDKNIKAVIHIHNSKIWNKLITKKLNSNKRAHYGTPAMALAVRDFLKQNKKSAYLAMGGHRDGCLFFGQNLAGVCKNIFTKLKNS